MTEERSDGLAIGEVARQAGMRPSALRYYEAAGLLPRPRRVSGRRRYDPDVLQRLAVVRVAQQAGFTIAELRTLLHGFGDAVRPAERWRRLAERKLPELDALIARAEGMKRLLQLGLACGCVGWDDCRMLEDASPTAARTTAAARRSRSSRSRAG